MLPKVLNVKDVQFRILNSLFTYQSDACLFKDLAKETDYIKTDTYLLTLKVTVTTATDDIFSFHVF